MNKASLLSEEVILHTPWPALVAINALNEKVKQLKSANEKLLAYLHDDVTVQGRTRFTKKPAPRISRARKNPKNQGQADRDKIIQSLCSTVLGANLSADEIQRMVGQVSEIIQCVISSNSGGGHGNSGVEPERAGSEVLLPQVGCRSRSLQGKRSRIGRSYQIRRSRRVLEKECPSDQNSNGCTQAKADPGLDG